MSSQRPLKRSLWRAKAACKGLPLDLFFEPENEALAVKVCETCQVRHECLAEAVILTKKTPFPTEGVWGGLNEYQRSKLRGRIK